MVSQGQPQGVLRSCFGSLPPTLVPGLSNVFVTAVAVGTDHVAVVASGKQYGYGSCANGALGVPSAQCMSVAGVEARCLLTPELVLQAGTELVTGASIPTTATVTSVAAGAYHTVALAGIVKYKTCFSCRTNCGAAAAAAAAPLSHNDVTCRAPYRWRCVHYWAV